jgi:YD repeat-containing protein
MLTSPSGEQVTYGYDSAERLRTMSDPLHPELTATFEYFGLGRLHTRQYGNGARLSFLDDAGTTDTGYDGVRRPVRMRHLVIPSNTLLAGIEYRYDRNGNPTSSRRLHDTNAAGAARGRIEAYDSANRLTSSQEAYLDANHVVASPLLDQATWTLDGAGNWANFTRNGTLYLNTPNNLEQYDEPQCCGGHSDDGVPDDFGDLAGTSFPDGINVVHDKAGNQIRGFSIKEPIIQYNEGRRRSTVTDLTTGSPIASYAYDALGRRTRRQVSGGEGSQGTWTSAWAGTLFPEAIEERTASGGVTLMAGVGPGGGCLWHLHGDGSSQYVLEDAFGSAVAVTPGMLPVGPPNVLERVVYDPYGKPTFESASNVPLTLPGGGPFLPESQYDSHHLFRGMVYDPELGARTANVNTDVGGLYADAGSYNPNQGRPMEGDPDRPPINTPLDSRLNRGITPPIRSLGGVPPTGHDPLNRVRGAASLDGCQSLDPNGGGGVAFRSNLSGRREATILDLAADTTDDPTARIREVTLLDLAADTNDDPASSMRIRELILKDMADTTSDLDRRGSRVGKQPGPVQLPGGHLFGPLDLGALFASLFDPARHATALFVPRVSGDMFDSAPGLVRRMSRPDCDTSPNASSGEPTNDVNDVNR